MVDNAEVIVGAKRHLAMLGTHPAERVLWPSPFDTMPDKLASYRGRNICVLATGDPTCHGVGSVLAEKLGAQALEIVPAPSAFSLARARLGWAEASTETLSLHGKPLAQLHRFVQPEAKLMVLSADAQTPNAIAQLLCGRGYEDSRLVVFSHLGGELESVVEATAGDWAPHADVANLNTVAIQCRAGADAPLLPRTPGLADEFFEHDGQLTKREVRAATLSALAPIPGQLLWDIGAGCGSVSIEWMRTHPTCRAIAIESDTRRIELIERNACALGTPGLEIVLGRAPSALTDLPRADAIFVGGGITEPDLFNHCWQSLKPGGRLVANVVSIEGERILGDWQEKTDGQLTRLAISRSDSLGQFRGWRPLMSVTQFSTTKQQTKA